MHHKSVKDFIVKNNVREIILKYSGSGDDGAINSIEIIDTNHQLLSAPSHRTATIEDLVYRKLEGLPDWVNNSGGGGTCTINVLEQSMKFHHYVNDDYTTSTDKITVDFTTIGLSPIALMKWATLPYSLISFKVDSDDDIHNASISLVVDLEVDGNIESSPDILLRLRYGLEGKVTVDVDATKQANTSFLKHYNHFLNIIDIIGESAINSICTFLAHKLIEGDDGIVYQTTVLYLPVNISDNPFYMSETTKSSKFETEYEFDYPF